MSRLLRCFALGILILSVLRAFPTTGQQGAADGQWRAYAGETGSTNYSPLDQINRDNVKNVQVAWTWKFDNFGNTNSEVTPQNESRRDRWNTRFDRRLRTKRTPAQIRGINEPSMP